MTFYITNAETIGERTVPTNAAPIPTANAFQKNSFISNQPL